jgi:hypothetical protein
MSTINSNAPSTQELLAKPAKRLSKEEIAAQLGAAEGNPVHLYKPKKSPLEVVGDSIKGFAHSAGDKIKNRFAK